MFASQGNGANDEAMRPPTPVVLTTDCGTEMDDQWALAHLALLPSIDLRGIVTTHAPNLRAPAAESATTFVAEVLEQLSLSSPPPILAGSSIPLVDVHTPHPNDGVDFILDQSRNHSADHRLVVLVIGAATDVASALLVDSTLADRIDILAMGFDEWPRGGDAWNVANDILAWQVMLASGAPITIGAADVCIRRLTLTVAQAEDLLGNKPPASYLVGAFRDWLAGNTAMAGQVTGDPAAWPVWDEVVVGHLLGLTTIATYPRPELRVDITFANQDVSDAPGPSIGWIIDIDAEALWRDLAGRLNQGEFSSDPARSRGFGTLLPE